MVTVGGLIACLVLATSASTEPMASNATLMQHNATLETGSNVTVTAAQHTLSEEQLNMQLLMVTKTFCGLRFEEQMSKIGPQQWCNWTAVARPYSDLTNCTEYLLEYLGLYWPNEVGEMYFVQMHQHYFHSCIGDLAQILTHPPDNTVLGLVLVPICVIPIMVTLVVWCSKNSEANTKK